MESSSNSATQDGQRVNRLAVQKVKTYEERRYRMKMLKLAMIAACLLGLSTTAYAHCGKCAGVKEDHPHTKPAAAKVKEVKKTDKVKKVKKTDKVKKVKKVKK